MIIGKSIWTLVTLLARFQIISFSFMWILLYCVRERSKLSANVPGVSRVWKLVYPEFAIRLYQSGFCELGTAFCVYVYLLISVCYVFYFYSLRFSEVGVGKRLILKELIFSWRKQQMGHVVFWQILGFSILDHHVQPKL